MGALPAAVRAHRQVSIDVGGTATPIWWDGNMKTGNVVLLVVTAGVLVLFSIGSRLRDRARMTARLAAIERKIDVVMAHLGVVEPPPEEPDVVRHLEEGEFIQAVKVYRERTGLGLADAKAEVERIAQQRGLGTS